MNLSDIREAIDGVLFTLRDGMEEDDSFRSDDVVFSAESHRLMVKELEQAIELIDKETAMGAKIKAFLSRAVIHGDPSGKAVTKTEVVPVWIEFLGIPEDHSGQPYNIAGDWTVLVIPERCDNGHHANCGCDREQASLKEGE